MRRAPHPALAFLIASALPALADDASDIEAARAFVAPVLGQACELLAAGNVGGDDRAYQLRYRTSGQDQDSPDNRLTLVQLACSSGAYNFDSVYLTRDAEGMWELLSFAMPKLDYDYADEDFTKLTAPPKLAGFTATTRLTNSEYAPETMTISANVKWRGIGDAWSAGEWRFVEGDFVLVRYEVDPTFQSPGAENARPEPPESYVVYDARSGAE